MANSGGDHGNIVFIAICNGVVVANRTAGLYNSINASFVGYFHAVGKGEEGIGSHHSSFEIKAKRLSLGNGLLESVNTACLAYAACQELIVFGKYNSVAFRMLHDFVGKKHVLNLGIIRRLECD